MTNKVITILFKAGTKNPPPSLLIKRAYPSFD
jgi:hypothetical protein